jgi:hypothetical protein
MLHQPGRRRQSIENAHLRIGTLDQDGQRRLRTRPARLPHRRCPRPHPTPTLAPRALTEASGSLVRREENPTMTAASAYSRCATTAATNRIGRATRSRPADQPGLGGSSPEDFGRPEYRETVRIERSRRPNSADEIATKLPGPCRHTANTVSCNQGGRMTRGPLASPNNRLPPPRRTTLTSDERNCA